MYCTDPEKHKARKEHRCMSCGEPVEIGSEYVRWRCYDAGDVGTIKMHPECHKAHSDDAMANGSGYWEFSPYSNPRGSIGY